MNKNHPDNSNPDPELMEHLLLALQPIAPDAARSGTLRQEIMERIRSGSGLNFLTIRAEQGEWIKIAPLVEMKLLHKDSVQQCRSFLLRMHPGAMLPPHDHPVDEECMVLEGEVMLGDIVARTGDYHLAPKGLPHGAIVSKTGALLFLRAGMKEHAA